MHRHTHARMHGHRTCCLGLLLVWPKDWHLICHFYRALAYILGSTQTHKIFTEGGGADRRSWQAKRVVAGPNPQPLGPGAVASLSSMVRNFSLTPDALLSLLWCGSAADTDTILSFSSLPTCCRPCESSTPAKCTNLDSTLGLFSCHWLLEQNAAVKERWCDVGNVSGLFLNEVRSYTLTDVFF